LRLRRGNGNLSRDSGVEGEASEREFKEETMKLIRVLLVGGLVASSLAAMGGATAHPRDEVWPGRAGPIVRGETTMAELREWFGAPDDRRVVRVACVRVLRARWNGLKVFVNRGDDPTVGAIFVRKRTLESSEHGELRFHTSRGLRVGDRHPKLKRLYPNADPIDHAGHIHYRLRTGKSGSYMMGKVIDGRVVQIESWPFEFC
jgi:hypothetical protein